MDGDSGDAGEDALTCVRVTTTSSSGSIMQYCLP